MNQIDIKKNETINVNQFNNESLMNVISTYKSTSITSIKIDILNFENKNFVFTIEIESMITHNETSSSNINFKMHQFISINETNINSCVIENSTKTMNASTTNIKNVINNSNQQTISHANTIDNDFEIVKFQTKNCSILTNENVSINDKFNQIMMSNHYVITIKQKNNDRRKQF